MGIEKVRLFARESVYWVNMNADTENTINQSGTCLEYQQTNHMRKQSQNVPCKAWELVGADILFVKNKICMCIVDY